MHNTTQEDARRVRQRERNEARRPVKAANREKSREELKHHDGWTWLRAMRRLVRLKNK